MSERQDHRAEQDDDPLSVSRLPAEEELRFSSPAPEIEGYQIVEKLGEAGQGQVWRAVQSSTGRHVALKVPRIGLLSSKKTLARFEREVEVVAQLKHPHIAHIVDSGVHRGLYYYAMELIEGVHLDRYVKDEGLSQRLILGLMKTICEAVQHAHQNGVVHRDLKPSNIIVTKEGHPYIVDFGLAKSSASHTPAVTVSLDGETAGTPAYMSPEQAAGHTDRVDTRTDVYSLGAILFMLLTGEHPHDLSGSHYDVLHRISEQEVTPPRKLNRNIDRDLEAVLLKALENNPDRRYSSAAGLAEDIDSYLCGLPLIATPRSRIGRIGSFARRHRIGVAVGLLTSVMGLAAIIILTVSTVLISREKHRTQKALEREQQALGQETQARKDAVQQRDLANQNLYVAKIRLGQQYWESGQILTLQEMLERYIPRPGDTDLRGWEWYYLLSLCHKDSLTIRDQNPDREAVAWSPDGQQLATVGHDSKLRIWDRSLGREVRAFGGQDVVTYGVAWSPKGQFLASRGDDQTVRLWDPESGEQVCKFESQTGDIQSFAWSSCGRYLAWAGGDGTLTVWDTELRSVVITFRAGADVSQVAWSPDGQRMALAEDSGRVRIYESFTGREILSWRAQAYNLWAIAWSPDGKTLASGGYSHPIVVWRTDSGQEVAKIDYRTGVNSLAWSRDGKHIAAATWSQRVFVWQADTGREVMSFRGHAAEVRSVAWDVDGRYLASVDADGVVKVWDTHVNPRVMLVGPAPGTAEAISWHPDGRLLASTHGATVRIWDGCTGENLRTLIGHTGDLYSVAWSPNGRQLASSGDDKIIRIWDTTTWQEMASLQGHTDRVKCVAWSPDSRHLASAGYDQAIRIWDVSTGQTTQRYDTGQAWVVSWSPDGRYIASSAFDGIISIWDTGRGDLASTMQGHTPGKFICSLEWTRDGRRLASGGWDPVVKVWDVAARRELLSLRGHTGCISAVAWSPDGRRLASASADGTAKIWDAMSGEELVTLRAGEVRLMWVAWSPDGLRVAAISADGFVAIWDASQGYSIVSSRAYLVDQARRCHAKAMDLTRSLRLPEAHLEYSRVLELDPNWTAARYERSQLCWQLQEYENALADLGQCVEQEPTRVEYLDRLASWLITCPDPRLRDPTRAAAHAETAAALVPRSGSLYRTLALTHHRAGQWRKSLDASQRAMDLCGRPESLDLLLQAMAHWQLGDRRQAFRQYQQATERLRESQAPTSSELDLQREAARLLCVRAMAPDFDGDVKGAEIVDMSVTSNCKPSPPTRLDNLLSRGDLVDRDGNGLLEHDTNERHMWRGRLKDDPWIEFNLGGVHVLDALRVWNFNGRGQTHQGTKTADILVWTREGGWAKVLDDQEFDAAAGGDGYEEPVLISLGGVLAEKLRLEQLRSLGDPQYVGLAKVQVFDVRNHRASRPSPADGSDLGVTPAVDLQWTSALDAASYRVHFGDDPHNLSLLREVRSNSLLQSAGLEKRTWYYWRVDTVRPDGSIVAGDLWTFCTGNLVAWWKLDDMDGAIATDSSGRGNHGRLVGGPQWGQERSGGVLSFDGQDDYVYVGNGADFNITSEITLACRIKVDKFTSPWQPIITKDTYSWRLQRAGHGRSIEFACTGTKVEGTAWGNVCGSMIVDDGQWHHIAGVCDGNKLYLYVDGDLDASVDCSGRINARSDPVLIGAWPSDPIQRAGMKPWCGCLDDVRVYSYALTPTEVRAICIGDGPGPLSRPPWTDASMNP
jgi:WD40 repeat protein/serine/threonine protein kinase